jgi:hypothetical protein
MIVVYVPGGRRGVWDLPDSTLVEGTVIGGGERTLKLHAVSRETHLFRRRLPVRIADGSIGRIWRVLRLPRSPSE